MSVARTPDAAYVRRVSQALTSLANASHLRFLAFTLSFRPLTYVETRNIVEYAIASSTELMEVKQLVFHFDGSMVHGHSWPFWRV